MTSVNLGNQLNQRVYQGIGLIFRIGELSQLAYLAFEKFAKDIGEFEHEELEFQYPIGVNPDRSLMLGNAKYSKSILVAHYQYLAEHQLALNGIYQLVTTIEAMLGDVCRKVILAYPRKLGSKKSVPFANVIEAQSLESLHLFAVDSLLHDLSYKSPKDFADAMKDITGVNLLEVPAFHRYIEVKATRDIHIHNQGVANDIYVEKADSHARVAVGTTLPVDVQYFLQAYEASLQVAEILEKKLHEQWPSSEYEQRLAAKNAHT